jgi:hypothetical protein
VASAVWLIHTERTAATKTDFVSELTELDLSRIVLPSAGLAPDQVVRLQLAGLSDQRPDGVGILQCYALASPANRAVTGPLERFGKMVRDGPFQCMAKPRAFLIGSPQVAERTSRVLVTVIDQGENIHAFTFLLSRQAEAPFLDCWMTEAVLPAATPLGEPTPPEPAV